VVLVAIVGSRLGNWNLQLNAVVANVRRLVA